MRLMHLINAQNSEHMKQMNVNFIMNYPNDCHSHHWSFWHGPCMLNQFI